MRENRFFYRIPDCSANAEPHIYIHTQTGVRWKANKARWRTEGDRKKERKKNGCLSICSHNLIFFSFNPFLCVLLFCMTFFRIADSPFFVSAKFPIYSECIIDFEIQMRPWTILDSIFFFSLLLAVHSCISLGDSWIWCGKYLNYYIHSLVLVSLHLM